MAVLTARRETALLATSDHARPILALVSPALANSLYIAYILQRLLSTTTLFVLFRAYFLSLFLLQQSYLASQLLLIHGLSTSSLIGRTAYWTSKQGLKAMWRGTEGIRKKLFRELLIFALGGGNGAILVVFWPGWIFIGGGIWAVSWVCS